MSKLFGEELKRSVIADRERIIKRMEDRQRRIDDCETDYDDCFISIHVDENALRECSMRLEILNGDGCMDYNVVVDENGNEVRVHWFKNKWGKTNVVANGIFASSLSALLKKTGWEEKTIRVPAWTKFVGHGTGMCGVMNGGVEIVRWHTNMVTGEYFGYPD